MFYANISTSCFWIDPFARDWNDHMQNCSFEAAIGLGAAGRLAIIDTSEKWSAMQAFFNGTIFSSAGNFHCLLEYTLP